MPIPPRPIPQRQARPLAMSSGPPPTRPGSATHSGTHTNRSQHAQHSHTRHSRPGFSVPQKAPSASLDALTGPCNQLEWRAEVALLDGLPRFRVQHGRLVGSAPNNVACAVGGASPGTAGAAGAGAGAEHGVMMVTASDRAREQLQVRESETRREGREVRVDLEGLIEQGRGKREKRVTTATSLGFDFIPNPRTIPTSTLNTSITGLVSPSTPALDPSSSSLAPSSPLAAHDVLDADGGDWEMEWEHVAPQPHVRVQSQLGQEEDEDDMIILGEMELDEPEHDVGAQWSGGRGEKVGQLTYAAALGRMR